MIECVVGIVTCPLVGSLINQTMNTEHFNKLTPAEAERLAIFAEECGEVIQIVGKILRHGYESHHPDSVRTNRELLAEEMGHIECIMDRMIYAGGIACTAITAANCNKIATAKRYFHHQ